MTDLDNSEVLEDLKTFVSSRDWDFSFLDDPTYPGLTAGPSINNTNQSGDKAQSSFGHLPQSTDSRGTKLQGAYLQSANLPDTNLPGTSLQNRKRKRTPFLIRQPVILPELFHQH